MIDNKLYYVGDFSYNSLEEALKDLAEHYPLEENIDTVIDVCSTKKVTFVDMFKNINLEKEILSFLCESFDGDVPQKLYNCLILDKDAKKNIDITLGNALDYIHQTNSYYTFDKHVEYIIITEEMIGGYYE